MNSIKPTVLDDYTALVQELPYWLREVYGKQTIDRIENFITENGGGRPQQDSNLKKS
jgi:hypothetical protein